MARRDRFRDLVWLARFKGEKAGGRLTPFQYTRGEIHTLIGVLTDTLGLWIELEQDADTFTLRCYPRTPGGAPGRPGVCVSYCGGKIHDLLAAAIRDYELYLSDPTRAELSRFEAVRWVA